MEAAFTCPGCGDVAECADLDAAETLTCPCGWSGPPFEGSVVDGRPVRCVLCGDPRLYVQKDFNRTVGLLLLLGGFAVAILMGVLVGAAGFFGTLFAAAGLDALLYRFVVGNVVVCHWCEAHFRGGPEDYPAFDLELHDRVRYQREVAAVGRRVPEHAGEAADGGGNGGTGPGAPSSDEAHPRSFDDPAA